MKFFDNIVTLETAVSIARRNNYRFYGVGHTNSAPGLYYFLSSSQVYPVLDVGWWSKQAQKVMLMDSPRPWDHAAIQQLIIDDRYQNIDKKARNPGLSRYWNVMVPR